MQIITKITVKIVLNTATSHTSYTKHVQFSIGRIDCQPRTLPCLQGNLRSEEDGCTSPSVRHGDICNGGIFGFSGAVGNYEAIAVFSCKLHGLKGFCEGADLIDFHENRVGCSQTDALFQPLGVGDKEIVSHQLEIFSESGA